VLGLAIDDTYPPEVRRALVPLTAAKLSTNALYRFAPPFLATIARGLDVDLADLGVAIAITEAAGFTSPLIGRLIDHVPRRVAMMGGLTGMAVGATIAGLSPGIVLFAVGLFVVAAMKVVFDVAAFSWTADHVPYGRRGRVIGLLETSWALGLLLGVTILGLITAATSWRVAYAVGAVGVLAMAVLLAAHLDRDERARHRPAAPAAPAPKLRLASGGWTALVAMVGLMAAAQSLFVTFGPWLEDVFGFGGVALSAVTFGIGGLELAASTTSAARTDRWGKERSVVRGTLVMIPCGLVAAAFDQTLAVGFGALAVFIAAFEFALVSTLPIGAELIPGAPGRGIGTLLAAGTVGRTAMAIPATRLYDEHGFGAPALLAVGCAAIAGAAMLLRQRLVRQAR
jgi:MFS transporter, DHA1 family, inner membrane transport protein